MKTLNNRTAQYPIEDVFINRYSSRAMSGELITKDEIMTLFEAARWAPSSLNSQPWRFVYAMKNTPDFEKLFSFILDKNKIWCKNASALVVLISENNYENGNPSITHSFNTGAAWENLALQATKMNIITHAIGGFNYNDAKEQLNVSDKYTVEIMIAIGKPGNAEELPEDLILREKPSDRKNLEEIVFEGYFKN